MLILFISLVVETLYEATKFTQNVSIQLDLHSTILKDHLLLSTKLNISHNLLDNLLKKLHMSSEMGVKLPIGKHLLICKS